jgi:hypothetical protein
MPRYIDYHSDGEIKDIMERILERFPAMFEGFDSNKMAFIVTKKKKAKQPIKIKSISYPAEIFVGKPYIVESFDAAWKKLDQKKKNLAVFRTMCAVPDGGFDANSKYYSKIVKPEIVMYMREYAAAGGVPNWMENPAASDPMERTADEMKKDMPGGIVAIPDAKAKTDGKVARVPITKSAIASVGSKSAKAAV